MLESANTGAKVTLDLDENDRPCKYNKKPSFEELPEDDQEKIKKLTLILDQFGVSDATHHELHGITDDLATSSLIVQCCHDIEKLYEIKRKQVVIHSCRTIGSVNIPYPPSKPPPHFGGGGASLNNHRPVTRVTCLVHVLLYFILLGKPVRLSKEQYVALFGNTYTSATKHGRRSLVFPVHLRHRVSWKAKPDNSISVYEKLVLDCAIRASAL